MKYLSSQEFKIGTMAGEYAASRVLTDSIFNYGEVLAVAMGGQSYTKDTGITQGINHLDLGANLPTPVNGQTIVVTFKNTIAIG